MSFRCWPHCAIMLIKQACVFWWERVNSGVEEGHFSALISEEKSDVRVMHSLWGNRFCAVSLRLHVSLCPVSLSCWFWMTVGRTTFTFKDIYRTRCLGMRWTRVMRWSEGSLNVTGGLSDKCLFDKYLHFSSKAASYNTVFNTNKKDEVQIFGNSTFIYFRALRKTYLHHRVEWHEMPVTNIRS